MLQALHDAEPGRRGALRPAQEGGVAPVLHRPQAPAAAGRRPLRCPRHFPAPWDVCEAGHGAGNLQQRGGQVESSVPRRGAASEARSPGHTTNKPGASNCTACRAAELAARRRRAPHVGAEQQKCQKQDRSSHGDAESVRNTNWALGGRRSAGGADLPAACCPAWAMERSQALLVLPFVDPTLVPHVASTSRSPTPPPTPPLNCAFLGLTAPMQLLTSQFAASRCE